MTETESPIEDPRVKVRRGSGCLSEIIAETIVYSFVQKQTRPEWNCFLTPCVPVACCEVLVMFYDSKHDVLLESSTIPLFESPKDYEMPRKLSFGGHCGFWACCLL